ncbi:MAG: T9SS type A sorting domain-containing protein [Bacteroidota bacterium]
MNKLILIVIIFFASLISTAQGVFDKIYTHKALSALVQPSKFTKASDGGYGLVTLDNDFFKISLIKTDSLGNVEWAKRYSGVYNNTSIASTLDGGFIVGATLLDTITNFSIPVLIKVNSSGIPEWAYGYGDTSVYAYAGEVLHLSDGNLLIGYVLDTIAGFNACLVTKTDFNGNAVWQKKYSGNTDIEVRNAVQMANSNIVIGGIGPVQCSSTIMCIDTTGNLIWGRLYIFTPSYDFSVLHVNTTSNNDIIATGRMSVSSAWDIFAMRLSSSGDFLWGKYYENSYDCDEGYSIHETNDGGLIICAEPESYNNNSSQTALIKTDSSGNLDWMRIIQPNKESFPFGGLMNTDGGMTIFGIDGHCGDYANITLMRTGPNFETDCEQQNVTTNPLDFTVVIDTFSTDTSILGSIMIPIVESIDNVECSDLCQFISLVDRNPNIENIFLSPNPTHGLVNIIGQKSYVTVYDQFGQLVFQKESSQTFDIADKPNGVYFVTLSNKQGTKTIMIIKN